MDVLSLYLNCLLFPIYINCLLILHHLNFWKTNCEIYYLKINHDMTLTWIYNNWVVGKSWEVAHDNKLYYFSFLLKYTLFFPVLIWDPVTMCMQCIAQRTTTLSVWLHQILLFDSEFWCLASQKLCHEKNANANKWCCCSPSETWGENWDCTTEGRIVLTIWHK